MEEAMTALLHVDNITKRFGGFVALDGIELEVQPGERLGLIGPNAVSYTHLDVYKRQDLLLNAIAAGLLLGGFYAAVTAGVSISFGMLDIVNIAHPAFIILGSYIAYYFNIKYGVDPIVVSIIALPFFYALGAGVYQVYYLSFEKRGQESLRGLAF